MWFVWLNISLYTASLVKFALVAWNSKLAPGSANPPQQRPEMLAVDKGHDTQATTHHPSFYFRQAYGLWDMDKPLPESEQQLLAQGRHGQPTTGFLVIMALKSLLQQGIIKELNLFGFQGQAHYSGILRGAGHSCVTKGTNTMHNFDFEHSLLRKMHAQGQLKLADGLKLPKQEYC